MHLLPIVTFGLLFIALTKHSLSKSVDPKEHTLDKASSKDSDASIIIETDSLASLLIVKLNSEQKKTH